MPVRLPCFGESVCRFAENDLSEWEAPQAPGASMALRFSPLPSAASLPRAAFAVLSSVSMLVSFWMSESDHEVSPEGALFAALSLAMLRRVAELCVSTGE